MKEFNEKFKTKLYQTIEDIENKSLVEVVAIFRKRSAKYKDVKLLVSTLFSFLVFTVLMFINIEIFVYLIYLITIFSFVVSYLILMMFPKLLKLFIKGSRMERDVEIMARAIFQKGGIRFTEQRIGILVFVSYFEQKVMLLSDRGVVLSVPQDDLNNIEHQFREIFKSGDVADNFLKVLSSTKEIFSEFIPPVENDINELPDNLKIDI